MKKNIATICMGLMILIFSTSLALAGNGQAVKTSGSNGGGTGIESLPYVYPSAVEIEAMIYMVEEEKVARDVYNALYAEWSIPAFNTIAGAEQRHMDAIIALLDKYGLDNPVAGLVPGAFANPEMQDLYDDLIAAGMVDEVGALFVGATIEDLDIFDLLHELELVDNEDITVVFQNLLKGSENHLRSFCALLVLYGSAPYEAQGYLSQEQIDAILAATRTSGKGGSRENRLPQENLRLDANGDGICDLLQQ